MEPFDSFDEFDEPKKVVSKKPKAKTKAKKTEPKTTTLQKSKKNNKK